jgi:magnesium-protoporphyrin O-methyltransferase
VSCCTPTGYRTIFGAKTVERDVRRYRRRGLVGSAGWLLERLAGTGVAGRSVLEVGGGIGGLQAELLRAGAAHATNVEIIDTYEDAARTLIAEQGIEDRVDRRIGDFATGADQAPTTDIVIMHRVICCYPDADVLLARACEHSRDRVAITVPRDSWWNRRGVAAVNAWYRFRRIGFQVYVHPVAGMLELAVARGFAAVEEHSGVFWESIILAREPVSAGG